MSQNKEIKMYFANIFFEDWDEKYGLFSKICIFKWLLIQLGFIPYIFNYITT